MVEVYHLLMQAEMSMSMRRKNKKKLVDVEAVEEEVLVTLIFDERMTRERMNMSPL